MSSIMKCHYHLLKHIAKNLVKWLFNINILETDIYNLEASITKT